MAPYFLVTIPSNLCNGDMDCCLLVQQTDFAKKKRRKVTECVLKQGKIIFDMNVIECLSGNVILHCLTDRQTFYCFAVVSAN